MRKPEHPRPLGPLVLAALITSLPVLLVATPFAEAETVACHGRSTSDAAATVEVLENASVLVTFRVDTQLEGPFGISMGHMDLWAQRSASNERVLLAGFLEDASGKKIATRASLTFSHALEAQVGDTTVRAGFPWSGGCTYDRILLDEELTPGEYRLVAFGASDAGNRLLVSIPPGAEVTSVTYGKTHRISEADLACPANVRVHGDRVTSQALLDCEAERQVDGRAYRVLRAQWGPDPNHDLHWRLPDGQTHRCSKTGDCMDVGVGGAGTWTLQVTRYVTPFAATAPGTSLIPGHHPEPGIFGALADAPAP